MLLGLVGGSSGVGGMFTAKLEHKHKHPSEFNELIDGSN